MASITEGLHLGVQCGNCKVKHPTVHDVKACYAKKYAPVAPVFTAPVRTPYIYDEAADRYERSMWKDR
jgi:hypothetical protein